MLKDGKKSPGIHTARFVKYVRSYFDMHEVVDEIGI